MNTYATDEDIAIRASTDFVLLCPKEQIIASGNDGSFATDDRWTLRSSNINLETNGVLPGQVVQLNRTAGGLKASSDLLVVHEVSNSSMTLRRKGQQPGRGQPPAPASGLTNVEFLILTFAPQILRAAEVLNRRFGILASSNVPEKFDQDGLLRDIVVLDVLHNQYLDKSRQSSDQPDAFGQKARSLRLEFEEQLTRLSYRANPTGSSSTIPRFSTRLSR